MHDERWRKSAGGGVFVSCLLSKPPTHCNAHCTNGTEEAFVRVVFLGSINQLLFWVMTSRIKGRNRFSSRSLLIVTAIIKAVCSRSRGKPQPGCSSKSALRPASSCGAEKVQWRPRSSFPSFVSDYGCLALLVAGKRGRIAKTSRDESFHTGGEEDNDTGAM